MSYASSIMDPNYQYKSLRFKIEPEDQVCCIHDTISLFNKMAFKRNTFASHWEEVAQLLLPSYRNTFYYGAQTTPGSKKTQQQVDSTGQIALGRFAAICDSLLTPRNLTWHGLTAINKDLLKVRRVRIWYEQASAALFNYRYSPLANFASQNNQNFQLLGAFGTQCMFVDKLFDPRGVAKGVRYRSCPTGEMFYTENHQGLINGVIRWIRMTAAQAEKMWPGMLPAALQTALIQGSQEYYDFLHRVTERADYDRERMDAKGKPFQSYVVCMQGRCLMYRAGDEWEGGYSTFPFAASRYTQAPGEVYGRGPAMDVLPSLKTLNAQKLTYLKAGHRSADPVLLTTDDGLVDFNMRPGALNKGGMSPDGKPLVGTIPVGNIQISEKMMEMERALIEDVFLTRLFQVLTETPQMSATEVLERTNEKGILLAPTVGRQQSEYLGPMIERELDVLMEQRLLPPIPQEILEAGGEFEVVYTSPLAKAARSQEASGFMRTLEVAKELVAVTQDPAPMDLFSFDRAIPAIAYINSVPIDFMATDDEIAQKRKQRQQDKQIQQKIQAMPAQAAMMKAQQQQGQGQPQQAA